jgi:ring-1,2-phenylacetyl-CoA epoxidase subunit PaaD
MSELTEAKIWELLEEVKDPEIPAVSVVELGLIRSVGMQGEKISIAMTPSFIGCPALEVMRSAVADRLREAGAGEVEVKMTLSPPWSSDWITPSGREKLKNFGLSPPPRRGGSLEEALEAPVACPYCGSLDTALTNSFGPTLCRAIFVCRACTQPFEGFKPV